MPPLKRNVQGSLLSPSRYERSGFAADKLLKAPLKLIGAKTGILSQSPRKLMYSLLPKHCETYVEPFLGSGGCLIGKPKHSREWVGDVNFHAIVFYRQLKDNPAHLYQAIRDLCQGMCKEKYDNLRWLDPCPESEPVQAAAWFYVINKWARNGIFRRRKSDNKCNSTYCKEDNGRGLLTVKWINDVVARIADVEFYWTSYDSLLTRVQNHKDVDQEKTIVYLDPPYSQVFTKYDQIDFTDQDHKEMADRLGDAEYYWFLNINDNGFIRKLYSWAHLKEINIYWQCSNTVRGRSFRDELIVTNYRLKDDR